VQSDPIGLSGGLNLYSYVGGNPTGHLDLFGLWSTEVHNALIKEFSETHGLSGFQMDAVMSGSLQTDSWIHQSPAFAYMHAMRAIYQSPDQAKVLACRFIKQNLAKYEKWKNSSRPNLRLGAYEALGAALHTVMDATSPSHRGFQVWEPAEDPSGSFNKHGNNSPEDADHLTGALKTETLKLMNDALNGKPCDCFQ